MTRTIRLLSIAALGLGLGACAVGYGDARGKAWGVAIGQAEVSTCARPAAGDPPEEKPTCTSIRGGAISSEAGKALGPLGSLARSLAAIF